MTEPTRLNALANDPNARTKILPINADLHLGFVSGAFGILRFSFIHRHPECGTILASLCPWQQKHHQQRIL